VFVVFVVISIILSIGVNSEDRASSKSLLLGFRYYDEWGGQFRTFMACWARLHLTGFGSSMTQDARAGIAEMRRAKFQVGQLIG
jgi:hypothetical protein